MPPRSKIAPHGEEAGFLARLKKGAARVGRAMIMGGAAVAISAASCSDPERLPPPNLGMGSGGGAQIPDRCATPAEGCKCDAMDEVVPCGEVQVRSGDYVTCSEGERTCLPSRRWGACEGDHVTTKYAPLGSLKPLALGTPMDCGMTNACDPYCNVVDDDTMGITPPTGICGTTGGFSLCASCAYSGPFGSVPYSGLPATWQRNGATCATDNDCDYDMRCANNTCQAWPSPCYQADMPTCMLANKVDLQVGAPCVAAGNVYHFPVCNRGAGTANAGTLRIGVFNAATRIDSCVPTAAPAPEQGYVQFTLGAGPGQSIPPGGCIDVNPGNSTNTLIAGAFGVNRSIAVNYNNAIAECNTCNNWNVWTTTATCSGCTGLQCNQACASTTLTGTIRDPRGVNPLPGVVVYVPNSAVSAFVDGVACDTCANLYSGSPLVSTVTTNTGTFSLANVPAGVDFPLVIQTGRWRRQVTVPAITACNTAALASSLARLPKNKAEGDIPKMALVMAAGDPLQCLFRKIGIDDAEFTNATGTGRIHLYTHNGMTFGGATNGPTNLWGNLAKLNEYNAIIAPCDNNHVTYTHSPAPDYPPPTPPLPATTVGPNYLYPPQPTATATQRANMKTYLDAGGRLFTTHWMAFDFTAYQYPNAVKHVFGSNIDADREGPSFPYTLDTTTPIGTTFRTWLETVGSSPAGSGTITFNSWRHLVESVNPPTLRLAYGNSTAAPVSHAQNATVWGGPQVSIYQFDTPWNVPAANQCGRLVAAQSHVSSGSGTFPTGCTAGSPTTFDMSPQEEAFEFLVFNMTQCVGLVIPPPPAVPLQAATFTRDYEAVCPAGHKVEWEFFSWMATVPPGTTITFTGQTADTQAGLGAAPSVGIGTASTNAMVWTSDPNTVNDSLKAAGQASRAWLRVSMTLNPQGGSTPTLIDWQQVFDCKPAE